MTMSENNSTPQAQVPKQEQDKKQETKQAQVPKQEQEKEQGSDKFFGNEDKKKEYPLPKSWENSVIIRESIMTKVGSKDTDVVEIPSSVTLKPFDKSLYDVHVKNGMFKGKKVQVIHDPR